MKIQKFLQAGRIGFKLIRYKLTKQRFPLLANLLLTNRCNLKCFYCYPQVFRRNVKDITIDKWLSVIDKLHDMGTEIIVLLGGEPLLYYEIDRIVDHIKQYGMLCELITNGYFVEKRIDTIKKLDSICLSIDGDEATNDRNRGKGSYRKAVAALETLKTLGVKTRIKAVITHNNIESLEHLCHLALHYNAIFTFTLPCVYESLNSEDLKISTEQIKQLIRNAIKYKQKGYPIGYTSTCLNYFLKWPYDYYQKIDLSNKSHSKSLLPCIKHDLNCYIDADGMMYHCGLLWSSPLAKNIFEVEVSEAWNNLRTKPCYTCGYISEMEINLLLSLSLENILEAARYYFKK